MVVLESIALAAASIFGGSSKVWGYNRELYQNDRQVGMAARFQRFNVRVWQVQLQREDIILLQEFT